MRVIQLNKHAVKMIQLREVRAHRREHLEKAVEIRNEAIAWRNHMIRVATNTVGLTDEILTEIDVTYNDMLVAAIELENSKCVSKH